MDYKKTSVTFLIILLCIPLMHSQFASVGEEYNRLDVTIKTFDLSREPTNGSTYLFKRIQSCKNILIKGNLRSKL